MRMYKIGGTAIFLSTPSARRATQAGGKWHHGGHISIHALREEGDPRPWRLVRKIRISIHALREEGDSKNREKILCFCLIIHLPAQIAKRSL